MVGSLTSFPGIGSHRGEIDSEEAALDSAILDEAFMGNNNFFPLGESTVTTLEFTDAIFFAEVRDSVDAGTDFAGVEVIVFFVEFFDVEVFDFLEVGFFIGLDRFVVGVEVDVALSERIAVGE